MKSNRAAGRLVLWWLALLAWCVVALQIAFALRIAAMAWVDPRSTTYERSEMWRQAVDRHRVEWSQTWVDYERISPHLKRAVIASEDAGFTEHAGIEWEAIEKAWSRHQRDLMRTGTPTRARLRGGSTITQQLAKNLLLSGERTILRKGQELALTWMLEAMLSKRRIFELYLNHVEWGDGLFGAQAAARHYYRVDASALTAGQAARLAVMLPAPKRFEQRPASDYVLTRAATIQARMPAVDLP